MLDSILSAPLWVFVICLAGAIITWFAADQFRDQILADSHRLVREVALRYLQIMIGLFAIFVLGVLLALWGFASSSLSTLSEPPAPLPTETASPTATLDPFLNPPTPTPVPTEAPALPTITKEVPDSDISLDGFRTARVVNTGNAGVNMRDLPTLAGNVIAIIPEGDVITVTGESIQADNITWHPVVSRTGAEGWVADQYLQFEDQ